MPTPPGLNVELPTYGDLDVLPRWAIVAYAARCASRVVPILAKAWPEANQAYQDVILAAVRLAESSAAKQLYRTPKRFFNDLEKIYKLTNESGNGIANFVVVTASNAVTAATSVKDRSSVAATVGNNAMGAAMGYASTIANPEALGHSLTAISNAVSESTWRDYELLKAFAERERWTDDTPVPAEFFGPLWLDGAPEGWPKEEAVEPQAIKIQFSVPRGMSDRESREFNERVKNVLVALSALDASMGGTGLQIVDDESFEPVAVEDEQPVHEDADCEGACA